MYVVQDVQNFGDSLRYDPGIGVCIVTVSILYHSHICFQFRNFASENKTEFIVQMYLFWEYKLYTQRINRKWWSINAECEKDLKRFITEKMCKKLHNGTDAVE